MQELRRDWLIYVKWESIVSWKDVCNSSNGHRRSEKGRGGWPFCYASNQKRMQLLGEGDYLWIVTLPKYAGYCQAPSIVARLEIDRVVDSSAHCPSSVPREVSRHGRFIALARRPATEDTSGSYPPLYNAFDVIRSLRFVGPNSSLSAYHEQLSLGPRSQAGPYWPLAQYIRSLRLVSRESSRALHSAHALAVSGRRVFLSYRLADLLRGDAARNGGRISRIARLCSELRRRRILAWWDQEQFVGARDAWNRQFDLIDELIEDGVQQATWFVALCTEGYALPGESGVNWTLQEWERAQMLADSRPSATRLKLMIVEFGDTGARSRLGGLVDADLRVRANASAASVAESIAECL